MTKKQKELKLKRIRVQIKKVRKALKFITIFNENELPYGYTVNDFKQEVRELDKKLFKLLREERKYGKSYI